MSDGIFRTPVPLNEPVRTYAPSDPARASLKARLKSMASDKIEIPCWIGGKPVRTGRIRKVVMPHSHQEILAECHLAGPKELQDAATAALKAKAEWEGLSWPDRISIFLKAAELLAGPFRDILNAATMLGQSKNAFQAEIDSACELIDFFRFNAFFYEQILREQPHSSPGVWNRMEYRPLEGFVLAITPFNFTSIAGNLPSVPALCGNTVVWKPSNTQLVSAFYIMKLFEEAGLPPGVINFIPTEGSLVSRVLLPMPELAGVHFTGSTTTFQSIYRTIGENISQYKSYPRIVGETGGKDFIFAHPSADVSALTTALVRGAFEYQGQKCSAASRAYIPKSLWSVLEERLVGEIKNLPVGDVRDFRNFVNAVIDETSYKNISGYLEEARTSSGAKILVGGKSSHEKGYFIDPTVIVASQPSYRSLVEEIFGPVLSLFVFDDSKLNEALKFCDESSPYGLTGAVFAQDRYAVQMMSSRLRNTAGNFYVNDKPTGAVVGQQPFGGARASGTNDKAGSVLNLYRWLSPRVIKETFFPPRDYRYPFMGAE